MLGKHLVNLITNIHVADTRRLFRKLAEYRYCNINKQILPNNFVKARNSQLTGDWLFDKLENLKTKPRRLETNER